MILTPLDAQFIRAHVAVEVTLHQPLTRNRVNVITGRLVGTMMASGKVHHYRVSVGEGVIYLAPPSWLVGDPPLPERQEKQAALDALIARHMKEIIAAHQALDAAAPEDVA
jgi:hypothetical protein